MAIKQLKAELTEPEYKEMYKDIKKLKVILSNAKGVKMNMPEVYSLVIKEGIKSYLEKINKINI